MSSVGVGLGSIKLPDPLYPGGVYRLPSWPVINTGEVAGYFEVGVSPFSKYFSFRPQKLFLEAGENQPVAVWVKVPFAAPSQSYKVVLEARPVMSEAGGQVRVGPVAGTKLSFAVGESPSVLGAAAQRARSFWGLRQPWLTIYLVVLCLGLAGVFLRRAFQIEMKIGWRGRRGDGK